MAAGFSHYLVFFNEHVTVFERELSSEMRDK